MAKYHVGENGPARCRALVRACPIGGDHFDNEGEAEREYDRQMRVKYTAIQAHRKAGQSAEAAEKVAAIIEKTPGAWVTNVGVMDLKAGDVLPDGRVVSSVEDERWMNIESRRAAGIGVYYMNETSEFPPGFSHEHFPQDKESVSDYTSRAIMGKVFRPALLKREVFTTTGNEIRDVPVLDLRAGDYLGDGLTVTAVDDLRGEGVDEVVVHLDIDWDSIDEEDHHRAKDTLYCKPDRVLKDVFVVPAR